MRYQERVMNHSGNEVKAMREELEKVKERALEVLARYEKTKAAVREDVKKEYARTIQHFENERTRREGVIKEKIDQIDKLQNKVESLNNTILGLESKNKLWEHECARIYDAYQRTVRNYSNPGLIEVQLQVISEFTDSLIRFVGGYRWGKATIEMANAYRDSILKKMDELVHEIGKAQEKNISLDSARKNVSDLQGK